MQAPTPLSPKLPKTEKSPISPIFLNSDHEEFWELGIIKISDSYVLVGIQENF